MGNEDESTYLVTASHLQDAKNAKEQAVSDDKTSIQSDELPTSDMRYIILSKVNTSVIPYILPAKYASHEAPG